MSIIRDNENFDFSNCTIEEKKDLIINLLNRQKELAFFLIESYPTDIALRIHLMFVIMICSLNVADYFVDYIPDSVISEDEFTALFAVRLNDYLD